MTDIVVRLRNPVGTVTANILAVNAEAANEIERLRALLAMALPYVDGPTEPGPSLRAAINEAVGGD